MFIPFCYYEAAANLLTNPVLDPFGKIPEFKYCAVRVTAGGDAEHRIRLRRRSRRSDMSAPGDNRFAGRRRPQAPETLTADTIQWLEGLPANVRPRLLPIEFARITNAIARLWRTPSPCLAYFDDLLIDKRGDRIGFPLGVMFELAALKAHYQTVPYPQPLTAWEEIAERSRLM